MTCEYNNGGHSVLDARAWREIVDATHRQHRVSSASSTLCTIRSRGSEVLQNSQNRSRQ